MEEYWDIETGEPIDESTLYERYDDMLDEVYGPVNVGVELLASRVLKETDPIAYRVGFSDWLDSELGETITDDEPRS